MRKLLGVLAGLALVATGGADVRFFFTNSADGSGLATGDPFADPGGNGTDGTDYTLTDVVPEVGCPTIDPAKGEFLYVWLRFEGEPNSRKIQGINIHLDDHADVEAGRGVYLGNDDNGDQGGSIRWNYGSQTTDPIVLVAIQEPGIVNKSGQQWLWFGDDDRIALLGAIRFDPPGEDFEIRMGVRYQGVSYSGQEAPMIKFGCNEEHFDDFWGETQWSTDPDAYIIPEPAGLLLVALASLVLRQR